MPEEPATPEAKALLARMTELKGMVDRLRARGAIERAEKLARLRYDDEEACAMFHASVSNFQNELSNAESTFDRYILAVGAEAREMRCVKETAGKRYEKRRGALAAKREREMKAVADRYTQDMQRALDSKNEMMTEDVKSRTRRMAIALRNADAMWARVSKGPARAYEEWLNTRNRKEFLALFKDGRVLAPDSVVCRACKSSACVVPGCARASTFQFGGGGGGGGGVAGEEELKKAASDRKRDVNSTIVMFCASGDSCALTLDKLDPERAAVTLPCKHVFDKDAIKLTTKCPTCRAHICVRQEYTGDKCVGLLPIHNNTD